MSELVLPKLDDSTILNSLFANQQKWIKGNSIEEANGYKRLIDEFKYDHEKVAKFIGKSRTHITNCLRLLSLPVEVIKLIEEKKIISGTWKSTSWIRKFLSNSPKNC